MERDKERKEVETERKQHKEQTHKQAKFKRQLKLDNNQVKLIEAEARSTKLLADGIKHQQQTQK